MPRDLLFTTCEDALNVIYPNTIDFQMAWLEANEDFIPIQNQFIRMLKNIPDSYAASWKVKMGIDDDSLKKLGTENCAAANGEDCDSHSGGDDNVNNAEIDAKMEEDEMEEN